MIGKVIVSTFGTGTLNTLFNGRIYPLVVKQTASNDLRAIYEVVNIQTNMSKESDSHIDDIDVRITILGTTYASVMNAIEEVRTSFVRLNGTIETVKVQSCTFESQRDLFSDDDRTYGSQVDLGFRIIRD